MPLPDLMSHMRSFSGLEEAPTPPPTPEDYLGGAGSSDMFMNPVVDNMDIIPYGGEEPLPLTAESGMPTNAAAADLPNGPESDMSNEAKADMHDMLAQRAKARATRSEYFQQKAREMAGKYF
jgi:hypothetical protein